MTDRFNGLIVTLEEDIREDDAEALMDAILMLRGVIKVEGHVSDLQDILAANRARWQIRESIGAILNGDKP